MLRPFSFIYSFLLFFSIQLSAQDVNIFLVGDAGNPNLPSDKNIEFLKQITADATEHDVLIFLGNNVFPRGLPNPEHPEREEMEKKLNVQLDALKLFNGKSFIIPGNIDWAQTRKYGWDYVKNQEKYVTDYLADESIFQPKGGCPGRCSEWGYEYQIFAGFKRKYICS